MKKTIYFLLILSMMACSSDSDSPPEENEEREDPVLTTLEINTTNGSELDLFLVQTIKLNAAGKDQFGQNFSISETVNWSANNSNVTVDNDGLVTAQAVGSANITASVGDISQTFAMTVIDSEPEPGTYIYVSDAAGFTTGPWSIIRYDDEGGNPTTFINSGLSWPQDILFLEDQDVVLVSNLSSNRINRYNANTGQLIGSFATGISGPTRMKIGPDNLLYVLQWDGDGLVLRYELNGDFVDSFTSVGVPRSIGLDWDAAGNLYVSSFEGANIRQFDENGDDLGLFVSSGVLGPTNIWFDDDGNLLVNDWQGNRVVQYSPSGELIGTVISVGLSQPEGIDFFPNGDFLIGSGGTSEIKQYDSDGNFVRNLVSAGAGGLMQPNAVRIREIE